ncbi:type I-C CRISPR-associated endonuclease Cas1c [Jannaschia helgolandensis]|uniref:type I-C CRISPR-associated endonuclease Cas1c n=1 Tax=Jannaschia helgolandensis TaxID=188906 RepID=UPI0030DC6DE7
MVKKLLNTLYVTTEGAYLRKDGETVAVDIDGTTRSRLPAHLLGQIVMFGETAMSPGLMIHAAEIGLSVAWLTYSGKLAGRLEGPQTGNVLLRRAQHRATDDPAVALPVARVVIAAKVANQRALLRRHLRDYGDAPGADAVDAAQRRLADAARLALSAPDLDILRGMEGEAANAYWSVFPHLIRNDDPAFAFAGRNRRPPRDPMNAVLSFLYAMAALDARAACEVHGLDPQMGFLHRDRPGRMSLALDLMEEVRAPLCDRIALSLVNRRQLKPSHLERQETGAVLLTEDGRKLVLTAWQERKRSELRHPWLDESIPLGLVLQVQAQILARHLRGDVSDYVGWLWS